MPESIEPEQPAGYRLDAWRATGEPEHREAPRPGPLTREVLGRRFVDGESGGRLIERAGGWLQHCEELFATLEEFVPPARLRQVYRAPLRSARQVCAAVYELHAAALLCSVARDLRLHVVTHERRRADACVMFLSTRFHVEVKTHEDRWGQVGHGGLPAARALARAAEEQCSRETPNVVVLGRVERDAVRLLAEESPTGCVSAFVWLELHEDPRAPWRAALTATPAPRHRFAPPQLEILRALFESH